MKHIFIQNEGCPRRALDANKLLDYFLKNNHIVVDKPEKADIIILFTCGFLSVTAEKSIKKIKEFQRYKSELIVAGCLPAIDPKKLEKIFNGKTIITKDLNEIDKFFPENKIKFDTIDETNFLFQNINENLFTEIIKKYIDIRGNLEKIYNMIKRHISKNLLGPNSAGDDQVCYIRLSWGCTGSCSYCSKKRAIGSLRSKDMDQCLKEFKKCLDDGYKNFILVAEDTGAYGLDIGHTFHELIHELTNIEGKYTISIRNLNPKWLIKYFEHLEKLPDKDKIKMIHSPIQSGCNRILRLMNRDYNAEEIKEIFLQFKKSFPDTILSTTYILGFPTETREEMKQTLKCIKETNFDSGTIFLFSSRPNTKAEIIEPKISTKEMAYRIKFAKKFLIKEGYYARYLSNLFFVYFDRRK